MKIRPSAGAHVAPSQCPVCGEALHVARLACDGCDTAIEGRFALGRLARLTREQLAFVEVFLEARGKIKDVEQALGISYPTVVSRLDEVVKALEPKRGEGEGAHASRRQKVLEDLAAGKITAADAAARLRGRAPQGGER